MRPVSISIRVITSIYVVEFHIYDILRPAVVFERQKPQLFLFPSIPPVPYIRLYPTSPEETEAGVYFNRQTCNSIYLEEFHIYDTTKTIVVYERQTPQSVWIPSVLPRFTHTTIV